MDDIEYDRRYAEFYGKKPVHADGADRLLVKLAEHQRPVETESLTSFFDEDRHWVKYRSESLEAQGYIEIEHRGVDELGRNKSKRYRARELGRRVVEEVLVEHVDESSAEESQAVVEVRRDLGALQEEVEAIREGLDQLQVEQDDIGSKHEMLNRRLAHLEAGKSGF